MLKRKEKKTASSSSIYNDETPAHKFESIYIKICVIAVGIFFRLSMLI